MEDAKLERYYLDPSRRGTPGEKVSLMVDVLGFTQAEALRAALVEHAQRGSATLWRSDHHGRLFRVRAPIAGPNGTRITAFITSWLIAPGSRAPRNITAFPGRRARR